MSEGWRRGAPESEREEAEGMAREHEKEIMKMEETKRKREEHARREEEKRAKEAAKRERKEEEARRRAEEDARRRAEKEARDQEERLRREEKERKKAEEAARKEAERKAALEAEARKGEEEARARAERRIRKETERVLRETRIPNGVLERFTIVSTQDPVTPAMNVLTRYHVGPAEVTIAEEGGRGKYIVNEPAVSPEDLNLYKTLMGTIYYSPKPVGEVKDRKEFINTLVSDHWAGPALEVPESSREVLRYYLTRDVAGYGVLDVLMNDQNVEEVECGGYSAPITVVHRDYTEYLRLETNVSLGTEEKVAETVQKLAQRAGKSVTTAYPYADFLLPEGHRGSATFSSEISLPGSTFDIRKFPENPLTITNLIRSGTVSPLMAAYQWLVMENRGFTLVIGPVSSGKTTMLNTMMSTLQPSSKIITVEDTPELKLVHQNWVRLITRSAYTMGAREVGLFDLVKASLRYRPDYLVVGEVRGAEIQSLVQAAAVGHGALTTLHADSPEAAVVRMRSPPLSVGESFLLLIWNFMQMTRQTLPNGKQARRVNAVTELVPDPDTMSFKLHPIFRWDPATDTHSPGDAADVVRRCSRLQTVMALRGWTNQRIAEELNQRAAFLSGLAEEEVTGYKDVASRIFSYYEERRRLEAGIVQR